MKFTHFPLHPDTPAEGRSLEDLFAGRGMDLAAMRQKMEGVAAGEGLPYGNRTHTYNSRLAQELGKWAEGQPGGEKIHDALFRAYFAEAADIGNPDVLLKVAGEAGLDTAEAEKVLRERSFSDAVDEDWQRSMAMGVTGVPTFVVGHYGVVGAQPLEVLEQLVQKAEAEAGADAGGGAAGEPTGE